MRYLKYDDFGIYLVDCDKDIAFKDIIGNIDRPYMDIKWVVGYLRFQDDGWGKIWTGTPKVQTHRCINKYQLSRLHEITEMQFIEELSKIKHYKTVISPPLDYGKFISNLEHDKEKGTVTATISPFETTIYDYIPRPSTTILGDVELGISIKKVKKTDDILWEAPKTYGSLELVPEECIIRYGRCDIVYRHPWRKLNFKTIEEWLEFLKWKTEE